MVVGSDEVPHDTRRHVVQHVVRGDDACPTGGAVEIIIGGRLFRGPNRFLELVAGVVVVEVGGVVEADDTDGLGVRSILGEEVVTGVGGVTSQC